MKCGGVLGSRVGGISDCQVYLSSKGKNWKSFVIRDIQAFDSQSIIIFTVPFMHRAYLFKYTMYRIF